MSDRIVLAGLVFEGRHGYGDEERSKPQPVHVDLALSLDAADVTSTTARLNASSFALDGLLKPLNLRTNCSADARISASVAGGSKLNSVLMFRHTAILLSAGRAASGS